MLVVRKLVTQLPMIKIVVMSATLQGDLLVRYFEEVFPFNQVAPPYFVGAKRYPVQWYFLDHLCSLADTKRVNWHEQQLKAAMSLRSQVQYPFEEKLKSAVLAKAEVTAFARSVCTNVIVSQANLGESILVFLPGIAEIARYYEDLIDELTSSNIAEHFSVFILHSQVPLDDQKAAFHTPPKGKVHVILATNIAESSVTLPKLRTVINFGVYRHVEYNSKRHISCLVKRWCSHSSCAQRAGRAGRVFEGVAVHLFSKKFYDVVMSEYDPPEMSTAPLAKLVLQSKQLGAKLGMHSPSQFLSLAIEPPSLQQMEAALRDLASLGAIATTPGEEVSEDAEITLLGHFSLSLPVDLVISRLILLGIFFGCPVDAVIMSAYISLPLDVFSIPSRVVMKGDREYSWCLWNSMKLRFSYDGGIYSDPMAAVKLFKDWIHWRNVELGLLSSELADGAGKTKTKRKKASAPKPKSRFLLARLFSRSKECAIRWERLLHFESLVSEIASRVLIHIPDNIVLHAQLKKLAVLATYQRAFRWSVHGPHVLSRARMCASSHQPDDDIHKFELVFCPDIDVLQALLAAAFSHQMLLGTHSYNCSFKKERNAVRKAMDVMRSSGLDHSRTVYMDKLRQTNKLELQMLIDRVFPFECYTQSAVAGDAGFVEFNPTFSNNPKTSIFRAHVGEKPVPDTQCSIPLPLPLYFFWQFGERRSFWRVDGVTTEFTMPKHSHALSWSRRSSEREFAVINSWRNLTGLIADMNSEQGEVFLSVASTIQGFDNRNKVSVKGLTLLPRLSLGPTAILMALAFEPVTSSVGLKVDTVNSEVVAVELSSQVIELGCNLKSCLKGADIVRVNNLRAAMSRALNASTPDGKIPMDIIGPIPQLLRNVLRQESSVDVWGTESQSYEVPAASTPRGPSLRATLPAIEEETGQQDSEVSIASGPTLVQPAPLDVPVCEWDDGLGPHTGSCAESDSSSNVGQFQYYPPLQCSLVTAKLKRETKFERTCTPTIFKPIESEISSILGSSPPQSHANEATAHVDSHNDGQEEEGACGSVDSGSDSSSGSFKLSPLAKPFVPNKSSTVDVQEPTCVPEGGPSETVPTGLVPWSLDSLSKEVLQFRSITQQGSPEDQTKAMGDPFQTLPLDFNSVSMDLGRALSGLPPFPPHYGFAMPSSPAHDYFSPEGNLSCLNCHSLALQPHLEAQRFEALNLTGEQLTNFRENLHRRIRQQHQRDAVAAAQSVVVPGNPKQNATSGRKRTRPPQIASKSLQQHSSSHGELTQDQTCRRDVSLCGAQQKGAHQAIQSKVDPVSLHPSPHSQARDLCTSKPSCPPGIPSKPRCPPGIPTAGHIPSSQSPPKTPCELSTAPSNSVDQTLPENSLPLLTSPLLPNPILHVYPSITPSSASLLAHQHGHVLSSPPSMALNSSVLSTVSNMSSGSATVLPGDRATSKRGVVFPPPLQHTHTCTAAMFNAPFPGPLYPSFGGQNLPVAIQQSLASRPCGHFGPFPPCWPRPPRPVYSYGQTPPFKPLRSHRHRTPEWIKKVYENYPHLPPVPGFPIRPPTVQSSFGGPHMLPATKCTDTDPLHSSISRPRSRSREAYPHKGAREPPRLVMGLAEEQQLVAFFVKHLKQHGGEASFTVLRGPIYALYRHTYNIPYHVLPPDRQFFHRHSDTFCIFGSPAKGFVIRLEEENAAPREITRIVPSPVVVPQDRTLEPVVHKPTVEARQELEASSKETHTDRGKCVLETGESSTDKLESVPTQPLAVEQCSVEPLPAVECCRSMEEEKELLVVVPSAVQEQDTSGLEGHAYMTKERREVYTEKDEEGGERIADLKSPAKDASEDDLYPACIAEPLPAVECCRKVASMVEEKETPVAVHSAAQEQEDTNGLEEHAYMTKERSEVTTEKDEEGNERIAEVDVGNRREEDEHNEGKYRVIGERPRPIGPVEGEELQEAVGEECIEKDTEEGEKMVVEEEGKESDEEAKERDSLGQEVEVGEVPKEEEEELKEVWSSSASESEDTLSNSTGCEEFWDTYSVTGVDIEVSSSTDDASSLLQTTATEEWPDSLVALDTPPVEIFHPCKVSVESQGSACLPTYLWEVLKPGEDRGCSPSLDQSGQPQEIQDTTVEGNSTLSGSTSAGSISQITEESLCETHEPMESMQLASSNSKGDTYPPISPEVPSSTSSPTVSSGSVTESAYTRSEPSRDDHSAAQERMSDEQNKYVLETLEDVFVELLKQHDGVMSLNDLLHQCRDSHPEVSSELPGVDFFTGRAHLFCVQEHSDDVRVTLALGVGTAPSALKRSEPNQGGSCSEAEFEERICSLLKSGGRWCKFTALCQQYRKLHGVTMWWDYLAPKEFILQRPQLFSTYTLRGYTWIRRNPLTATSHDQEKQMVTFFVRYLQRKRTRVRCSKLGAEYRAAHGLQEPNCWLDVQFFDKWPKLFMVHRALVELTPAYRGDSCSGRERHLEQEIARYLARNGRMGLLSAVTSDKKIDVLCSVSDIKLTPHFFEARPKIFAISMTDAHDESDTDWHVSLLSDAPEASSGASDEDCKPSSLSRQREMSPEAVQMKKKKKRKSGGRQRCRGGVSEDGLQAKGDGDKRKPLGAPPGYRRRREDDTSAGERKPRSAPAGRTRSTREEDWPKRSDRSDRPRSSGSSGYPSRSFAARQTS